jgi:proteasome lid subunit RPN8/RPN11
VKIARALHDDLVAHAREDSPNECCGLIATRDGEAVRVVRVTNAAASPLRYEMEPREQLAAITAIDDDDLEIGAIYHSHTRSAPEPSQTDINLARNWPDPIYVIVGVHTDADDVRAWRITGDDVEQVALDVVD